MATVSPVPNEFSLMADMTPQQQLLFQAQMLAARKNPTTALLLTLFLGGLGAHHFYMGNAGLGVLYLLFCWTFVPVIVALIELFIITDRVREYNQRQAVQIAARVKTLTSAVPA